MKAKLKEVQLRYIGVLPPELFDFSYKPPDLIVEWLDELIEEDKVLSERELAKKRSDTLNKLVDIYLKTCLILVGIFSFLVWCSLLDSFFKSIK